MQAHDNQWIAIVSREWGSSWKEDPDGMRIYQDRADAIDWLHEQVDTDGDVRAGYAANNAVEEKRKRALYRLRGVLMGMGSGEWVTVEAVRREAASRKASEVTQLSDDEIYRALEISTTERIGTEKDRRWRVPEYGKRSETTFEGTRIIVWDGLPWHHGSILEHPNWGYYKNIEAAIARIRRGYALPVKMSKSSKRNTP